MEKDSFHRSSAAGRATSSSVVKRRGECPGSIEHASRGRMRDRRHMTSPGNMLGPYEILGSIGAGGMGEVYRARDTRLGREVAIKVLPARFAGDADRLRRFEQEARASAALNHPNILAIYDFGTRTDGSPYIASELLDGETLRDRLRSGPLPVRKVIDYSIQIARGIAAANDKGIVHRDLKPENLFITNDGRAKILDFGLAKLTEPDAQSMKSSAPTEDVTSPGAVLGTLGYMSPEQVRGRPADHRSDIFSLGAIIYEMVSGNRAFHGDTAADTMSAILKDEPAQLAETNKATPPALERIIRHCLEKNPDERFQSARDIAFDLEALSTASTTTVSAAATAARRRWNRRAGFTLAAALILVAAVALGWMLGSISPQLAAPVFRQLTYRHGTLAGARFAPGGDTVFYTASWEGGPSEIFSVSSRESGGHSVDIKDAVLLSISSKGELAILQSIKPSVTYVRPGTLARTSLSGGAPKAEIENVIEADWTPDGSVLAIVRSVPEKRRCQVEYPLGKVLYEGSFIGDLRFSRDGKYLAFAEHVNPSDDMGNVVVINTDGSVVVKGDRRSSLRGVAWSPSGREVWSTSPVQDGGIYSLSLDGKTKKILESPGHLYLRDVSPDGRVLASHGMNRMGVMFQDKDGKLSRDLSWMDWPYLRRLSPDGKTILFDEEGNAYGRYETMIRDTDGSPAIRLGEGYGAALSRDKVWALSVKLTVKPNELWLLPVGAGEARRLSPPNLDIVPGAAFLADGKRVIYVARDGSRPQR